MSDDLQVKGGVVGASAGPTGLSQAEPQEGLVPPGFDPSRADIDEWLLANCGRGLPYGNATDLRSALHGLAYTLRQIEGTSTYRPHIGQCNSATTALRWAMDYIARAEMRGVITYWRDDNWLSADGAARLKEAVGSIVSMCADARDVFPDHKTSFEAVTEAVNELYGCIEDGVFARDSDGSPKGGDGEAGSVACDDSAGPKDIAHTPPSNEPEHD